MICDDVTYRSIAINQSAQAKFFRVSILVLLAKRNLGLSLASECYDSFKKNLKQITMFNCIRYGVKSLSQQITRISTSENNCKLGHKLSVVLKIVCLYLYLQRLLTKELKNQCKRILTNYGKIRTCGY